TPTGVAAAEPGWAGADTGDAGVMLATAGDRDVLGAGREARRDAGAGGGFTAATGWAAGATLDTVAASAALAWVFMGPSSAPGTRDTTRFPPLKDRTKATMSLTSVWPSASLSFIGSM